MVFILLVYWGHASRAQEKHVAVDAFNALMLQQRAYSKLHYYITTSISHANSKIE